ncbi:transferases folic acid binding [Euphorbia peplus]|nr:transferases folic acid binding [Euphorbia peplus]
MESKSQTNSIEDIFDSSLNLEETHLKEGYEEGYKHGILEGKEEARETGLKTGFVVGEELGFYRGCVDVWNSVIRVDPNVFSPRIQKFVKEMEVLIEKYPLLDPEDDGVEGIMDLRLKFRIVRAGLGVKLEYDGYPKPNNAEF